jgi:hypothetical protein
MRGGFSDLEYRREIAGVREMLGGLDEPHWREYLAAWPEEASAAAPAPATPAAAASDLSPSLATTPGPVSPPAPLTGTD